jgi:ParB-like chromosome segregation protein Spo0J
MVDSIRTISLEKLVDHPDNPNRMSKANFAKLARNIERTGRYEPLVVRPCPGKPGLFQIINGHHRRLALKKLGYKTAQAVVWDVDDRLTDVLLATLNRLAGSDILEKKLALLTRLSRRMQISELAKLLPQTATQLRRLTSLKIPAAPASPDSKPFAAALVFFVSDTQLKIIEKAMSVIIESCNPKNRAAARAAALAHLARNFLENSEDGGADKWNQPAQ